MNRILSLCVVCLSLATSMGAPSGATYVNHGTITSIEEIPIDVRTFVNRGRISIASLFPFETFNTLNYSNIAGIDPLSGNMVASPGFFFGHTPSGNGSRGWAANFFNDNNAVIEAMHGARDAQLHVGSAVGTAQLQIWATNVTVGAGTQNSLRRASLIVGSNGELEIHGRNVNLTRSGLEILPVWDLTQGGITSANNANDSTFTPALAVHDLAAVTGEFGQPPNALSPASLWDGSTATSVSAPPSGNVTVSSFQLLNPAAESYISGVNPYQIVLTNYFFVADPDPDIAKTTNVVVEPFAVTVTNLIGTNVFTVLVPSTQTFTGTNANQTEVLTTLNPVQFEVDLALGEAFETNFFSTNITVLTDVLIPLEYRTAITVLSNIVKGAVFASAPPGYTVTPAIGGGNNNGLNLEVLIQVPISNAVTGLDDFASIRVQDSLAPDQGASLFSNDYTGRAPVPATTRPSNLIVDRSNALTGGPELGVPPPNFFSTAGFTAELPGGGLVFTPIIQRPPLQPPQPNLVIPIPPYVGSEFTPEPQVTAGTYSAYQSFFDNVVMRPRATATASITNATGRVEINAHTLNLDNTRIRGEGSITISTPHLVSSTNTIIDCENLLLDLASTNGTLRVQNLAKDEVTRLRGQVVVWSALWQNEVRVVLQENYVLTNSSIFTNIVINNGETNEIVRTNFVTVPLALTNDMDVTFHTLMVSADALELQVPVKVRQLRTRSPDVIIDDNVTLGERLLIEGRSLTVNGSLVFSGLTTTNPVTGLSDPGTPLYRWTAANSPDLVFLTNNGIITVIEQANLGADRSTPFSAIVNNGSFMAWGLQVNSTYLENFGDMTSEASSVIQADFGLMAGANTSYGESIFRGRDLLFFENSSTSGGATVFSVTNSISDGGFPSVFTTENGLRLLVKPRSGDLLGSTVLSLAPDVPAPQPLHVWAGEDRGASAAGFQDNVAIGALSLQLLNPTSNPLFIFSGAGAQNGLYVEVLDLTALSDIERQLRIQPNMTIYFAAAFLNFTPPDIEGVPQTAEEYLDGRFGGRLQWVSDFAGPASSATVNIGGEEVVVNAALAQSWVNRGIDPATQLVLTPISIQVFGNGTVSPLTSGQSLIVGQTYTLVAQPSPGATFEGWSGSINSDSPEITFVMEEGIELFASFSYSPVGGTYHGLFISTNDAPIELDEAGLVQITTTAKGKYSGFIRTASGRYTFSGNLDEGGSAGRGIPGSGFYIELQAAPQRITGALYFGDWSAPFVADRNSFSKANPAPFAGNYTIVFAAASMTNEFEPQGDGFATVRVDQKGKVKLVGSLADGTKITHTGFATRDGSWPLFLPLYKGNGHLVSWQLIEDIGDRDIGGMYNWVKWPSNARIYPDGFNITADSFGSRFQANQRPLTGFSDALVFLSGTNLSEAVQAQFIINNANKAVPQSKQRSLKLNKDGTFNGSIVAENGARIGFRGVVLQKQAIGSGYFLRARQSGQALLRPRP